MMKNLPKTLNPEAIIERTSPRYSFRELVDIEKLQGMIKANYISTGIPTGIVDTVSGEIYAKAGWNKTCSKLKKVDPTSKMHCITDDNALSDNEGRHFARKSQSGCWEIGFPIHCLGEHIATLFLGQFFYCGEEPGTDFFISLAKELGLKPDSYLASIAEVPLVTREKINEIIEYCSNLTSFLSSLASKNMEAQNQLHRRMRAEAALKQRERELRFNLELLNSHITASPLAVVEWDSRERIVGWSRRAEEIFGWHHEDVIGKSWREGLFVVRKDILKIKKQTAQIFDSDCNFNTIEAKIYAKDGSIVSCKWHNSALRDEQGNVISILSQVEDITDFVEAHEALVASEERLRSMFENMISGLVVYETLDNGNTFLIKDFNPMAEKISGIKREDALGKTLFELYPETTDSEFTNAIHKVWEEGSHKHLPPFFTHGYAREGWRECRIYKLPSGDVVTIFEDVTERIRIRHELIKAKDNANAASRAKSEFLANMSHEIRTPLNGIMGMFQLLAESGLGEDQHELVLHGIQASKRLTNLLSDILNISTIEAGRLVLKEEDFKISDVLDSVIELLDNSKKDSVEFSLYLDEKVPDYLYGDPLRIQQILFNLVGNAIKYTDNGLVSLSITALPPNSHSKVNVLFKVTDSGIGIEDNLLDKIFSPFIQGEGSFNRRYQGAGLGLAIVKRLVDKMGGTLSFMSKPGEGTKAYFSLGFDHNEKSCPLPPALDTRIDKLKILLAEDDLINQLTLSKMVKRLGHDVTVVGNGEQVLEALNNNSYNAILMDIQMPEMSGLEATKIIRKSKEFEHVSDIPIIAVSAYAMNEDKASFLNAGMNAYLSKPIDATDLKTTLRKIPTMSSQHGHAGAAKG